MLHTGVASFFVPVRKRRVLRSIYRLTQSTFGYHKPPGQVSVVIARYQLLRISRTPNDFYHTTLCIAPTICCRKMSVCWSVCLSHAGILLKRLNLSSNFFTVGYRSHTILGVHTKRYGNIETGTPLAGASNAGILALSRKRYKMEP